MITAIILAAGKSTRMGKPKMLLPWRNVTIIEQVIQTIQNAGIHKIVVITGGHRHDVEKAIQKYEVDIIFNAQYEAGEMLSSIQCGIRATSAHNANDAILICLGDQPQVQAGSVRQIVQEYAQAQNQLVVPSHQKRRGHPWLVGGKFWDEIMNMQEGETMRDFLNKHNSEIRYVEINSSDVLQDIDTQEDYKKSHP